MRPTNQFWSCLMCESCHFERSFVEYWNWHRILNVCLWFFFFHFKKRMDRFAIFVMKSCPKINLAGTVENTRTKNIQYSTLISRFNDLSKWHDTHISSSINWWIFDIFVQRIFMFKFGSVNKGFNIEFIIFFQVKAINNTFGWKFLIFIEYTNP